jgi:hypothetical protein
VIDTKPLGWTKGRNAEQSYWQRDAAFGLLPLLAGISLIAAVVYVPQALGGNADFRQLYAGGYMLRMGLRHELYEPALQHEVENAVVSFSPQILPINHPAYEYLFFLPFTYLAYPKAYAAWAALNIGALSFCAIRISRTLDPWLTVALVAGFAPVWATLLQGQDSVWLLLFFLLANHSDNDVKRGALLGLTAFRFHLLIPVIVMYAFWRRWRCVLASILSAVPLALLSIWLVGIRSSVRYVQIAAASTEVRKGAPTNIYGFFQTLFGSHSPNALIFAAAVAVLSFWFASRLKPSLPSAILLIPLASYYLMLHDLVILLIPLTVYLRRGYAAILQVVVVIVGLFPPAAFVCGLPSGFMLLEEVLEE